MLLLRLRSMALTSCWLVLVAALTVVFSLSAPAPPINSRVLSRQIRQCGEDVNRALDLVRRANPKESSRPFEEAIGVCGKANDLPSALAVLELCPTDQCRALVISLCGRSDGNLHTVFALLDDKHAGAASFNSAIASCAHSHSPGSWKTALAILDDMPVEYKNLISYHAVLTVLVKARRGQEAFKLLNQMKAVTPNRTTYQLVFQALIREGELDKSLGLLDSCQRDGIDPPQGTIDLLVAGLRKEQRFEEAAAIEKDINGEAGGRFQKWDHLEKVGSGKSAYFLIGEFAYNAEDKFDESSDKETIIKVALQPNRNPRKNGMRLIMVDERGDRLGFLLMVNTIGSNREDPTKIKMQSSLLGLRIDEKMRGKGYAKVLLAIWIECCLQGKVQAATGKINKPLIALLLKHSFGFSAMGGVECTAGRGPKPGSVVLFSNSAKSLEGVFSPWDLQTQSVILSPEPVENGREISIGATHVAPGERFLQPKVDSILTGRLSLAMDDTLLRATLLGL